MVWPSTELPTTQPGNSTASVEGNTSGRTRTPLTNIVLSKRRCRRHGTQSWSHYEQLRAKAAVLGKSAGAMMKG